MDLYVKAAEANLDYPLDWSEWLGSDTIATSTWSADDDLTISGESNTNTVATCFIAGGTLGKEYIVTNHITTAGDREDERSFRLLIEAT